MTEGKAVIFGAGNVGRGFLGDILADANMEVVFLDINDALIQNLNTAGGYTHVTVTNGLRRFRRIRNVRAARSDDPSVVKSEVAGATIIATCVGARVLPRLSAILAPALLYRIRSGQRPVDILLAENLHDAPAKMRQWLTQSQAELAPLIGTEIGLVATSIGRMIPAPKESLPMGMIEVEPYRHLPLDAAACVAPLPPVDSFVIEPNVDFSYFSDRKLYIHNMGHAMTAYLGRLSGDQFIWEAISRPEIWGPVRAAMTESAVALSAQYRVPSAPLLDHIDDLLFRFTNRALGDTVARVGGDPARKTSPGDRFQGALEMCRSQGVASDHILLGFAAALAALAQEGPQDGGAPGHALNRAPGMSDRDQRLLAALVSTLQTGYSWSAAQALLLNRYQGARVP